MTQKEIIKALDKLFADFNDTIHDYGTYDAEQRKAWAYGGKAPNKAKPNIADEHGDSKENINSKYKDINSSELFVSLQKSKDNDTEYNDKIDALLRRVESGKTSVQGELEEIQQEEGTEVQLAAAIIARDKGRVRPADCNDKADERGKEEAVERGIESYAKSHGVWESKDNIVKNSDGEEMLAEGGENQVYLSKDDNESQDGFSDSNYRKSFLPGA